MCSVSTVQESRMCTAVVKQRVKHGWCYVWGIFSYLNVWLLERKCFSSPVDNVRNFNLQQTTKVQKGFKVPL